jgi:uncharacterized membrane protein YhiD involved in acid resistance
MTPPFPAEPSVLDPSSPMFLAHTLTVAHAADILFRLVCALVLGALVANRPWRRVVGSRAPRVLTDTAQTQTIIAVAGALLVIVIGDSLARAFGLVGLGTFIRFRAGVQDPRDVAVLFVMIGIGMACGLGLIGTAAVGTLFIALVLAVFDRYAPLRRRSLLISVVAPDPASVRRAVSASFPAARAVGVRKEDGTARTSFSVQVTDDEDALTILDSLQRHGATDVQGVRVEEQ